MNRRQFLSGTLSAGAAIAGAAFGMAGRSGAAAGADEAPMTVTYFDARPGSRSRDVAFAPDGTVWYCGQRDGTLTRLDPEDETLHPVSLGVDAAPHGVVWGPDEAFWITEGGQNAIARLDPSDDRVELMPLPAEFADANLNTGVFDPDGIYWFTGQNGVHGRVDPADGHVDAWPSPGGRGPYGITVTPAGDVWYASLAGSHIARVDRETGAAQIVRPPTPDQGARRVWSDSFGRIWVSAWNTGQVAVHDPGDGSWREWTLPGDSPQAYAVYVDERDKIWLTDFGANAIVLFDPDTERFTGFASDQVHAQVRQLAGRPGEVWGGESGVDRLVRIAFGSDT